MARGTAIETKQSPAALWARVPWAREMTLNAPVRIYRPQNLQAEIIQGKRHLQELMEQAAAIRTVPLPDTFLGRARHEILPLSRQDD